MSSVGSIIQRKNPFSTKPKSISKPLYKDPRVKTLVWQYFQEEAKGKFILTEENKPIVFTLLMYFLGDPDFNKHGVIKKGSSLRKGILIYGDIGVGKTTIFMILHKVGKRLLKLGIKNYWFSTYSSKSLVEDYMQAAKDPTSNFDFKNLTKGKLYLDDVGFEDLAFGRIDVLADLFFERNRTGAITFVTTNESPSQLANRYGGRIADRLIEDFNIIKWSGSSFRS